MNFLFSTLYNILMYMFYAIIPVLAFVTGRVSPRSKFCLFLKGQAGVRKELGKCVSGDKIETVWVHCASLGEFGIARPIIKGMKKSSNVRIVVTFFSPSGYEVVSKKHPDIDHVFYLPLDTPSGARMFLDTVRPSKAVFMVSELWLNYLREINRRNIPAFLVSAQLNKNSLLTKWYGGAYRELLGVFSCITTLAKDTIDIFKSLGYNKVEFTDDPLCDNVMVISQTPYRNDVLERFSQYGRLFIAGSVNDETDMRLMFSLINRNPDTRFVFVPHEVSKGNIARIRLNIKGRSVSYGECRENTDLSDVQVLIVDYVGELSYIYRYGTWAYVGGGFTPYLHNMLEATVYGLPVSFGPVIDRKEIARMLVDEHVGWIVGDEEELCRWFMELKDNDSEIGRIKHEAKDFIRKRIGGTDMILSLLGFNKTNKYGEF